METRSMAACVGLLGLLGFSGAVPAGADAPRILYVDPGANDGFATIQEAVDAALPGDTVLVAPGVYAEEVYVTKERLTIRGLDREGVVLEGGTVGPACEEGRGIGIYVDDADGVTVDNLTAQNYRQFGVYWNNVTGFFGTRITAANNCVYGLLTHDADAGELAFNEAYGSGDSGLYVGEVQDCGCVLHHNDIHDNVIGFSGTKGNGILIENNWFHDNGVGVLPNTLTPDLVHFLTEHVGPGKDPFAQCCVTIRGNLIEENNNRDVAPHGFTETVKLPYGTGVELAGASNNTVEDNVVRGHDRWGVAIHWLFVPPDANTVRNNAFADNAKFDVWWDEWGVGNCFEGNGATTSDPAVLPACGGALPSVGVPSARKDVELLLIALGQEGLLPPLPGP